MSWIGRHRAVLIFFPLFLAVGAVLVWCLLAAPRDPIPQDAILVPEHAATLGEALARVEPGGTIVLDANRGAIAGPVVVSVPGITVRSTGAARIESDGNVPAVTVQAGGVTLRDLEVHAASVGIQISAPSCRVVGVAVRDTPIGMRLVGARDASLERLEFEGGRIGLELSSSSGGVIRRVAIRATTEAAIRSAGSWSFTLEQLTILGGAAGLLIVDASRELAVRGARIEGVRTAVSIADSSAVTLVGCVLRDVGIGVAVDRATDCEVSTCTITGASEAGVSLQESVRNRVLRTTITAPQDAGIRLVTSGNNTLSGNTIRRGADTGIVLTASDRNLVERNEIRETPTGLECVDASACRILSNRIVAQESGLVLSGGIGHHVMDNRVAGRAVGIAGIGTQDGVLLRNDAVAQSGVAIALLGGSTGNRLSRSRTSQSEVGLLLAAVSDCDVLDNEVVSNDVGALLLETGYGLRIEGNRFARNAIGFRQVALSSDLPPAADALRDHLATPTARDLAPPILTHNVFVGNGVFDIENSTGPTLNVAGNRWSSQGARVSANVSLRTSAWKGTVALGTGRGALERIVGHILEQAVARMGYRVVGLIGVADPGLLRSAARAGDVDLIFLEVSDADPNPLGPDTTSFELPARPEWAAVVPRELADHLVKPDLSSLAAEVERRGESLLWVVPEACSEAVIAAAQDRYGLAEHVRAVVRVKSLEEAESLLRVGAAQVGLLPSLEEAATSSGCVRLEDDRRAIPSAGMAAVVRDGVLQTHPDIRGALARILPALTPSTLHDLVGAVRLSGADPDGVADDFLARHGWRTN